jgi:hypothetical protein
MKRVEYVSWDTKMKGVESWKLGRCCGINRRVHGYENLRDIFLGYRHAIYAVFQVRIEGVVNQYAAVKKLGTKSFQVEDRLEKKTVTIQAEWRES